MTNKQARFVEEYLKDLNATAAAIRAGYSEKTANEQGPRLLVNVSIQQEIQRLQNEISERTKITVDKVVGELAKIAFANVTPGTLTSQELADMPEEVRCAIAEYSETPGMYGTTRKIKLHNKLTAMDMLMKHLGGYITSSDLIDKLPPERLEQLVNELLQKLNK